MAAISDAQFTFAGVLGYACTIPGTCLCFLVLVAYAAVASSSKARSHLDRVSFRLIIYSLVFNILYGIAFSVTAAQVGPGSLCNFGAFATNFTLTFAVYFTTCIALNLQLVLVHRLNGRKMEKYYVMGTVLLAIVLTVPAYGLDQFGWDEQNSTCWFKNPNDELRLRWLVGTQSFWILLAATIETISSAVVFWWIMRFQMYTRHAPSNNNGENWTKTSTAPLWSGDPATWTAINRAGRYRHIIYRIALYPLVSLIINVITVALDLNQTIHGVETQSDFRLLVLDLILYGLRTFVYAILAIGDPSFINAIREMRGKPVRNAGTVHESQGNLELQTVPHVPVDGDSVSISDSVRKRTIGHVDEGEEDDWEFRRQL
ncbi:hypothetical protein GYMLUDRAFT_40336 [Collybiopsis luxurians FD-317 M1]|uniref:G-protein coupled receptors family 2 profile 2 domain-containing protein n=1 Tax=Collybiopsis luxurians FD-317 M1 TaxID=944289 RepID=A0A0D0CM25_9AGAR|nr:hypothetical protein GYMLUDRAFT_40336 [Collybiopsis luxurians FD-317 M1]